MRYGSQDFSRPIPLVWDQKQLRNERLRFNLVVFLAVSAVGFLLVEAFDIETMLGYAAELWDAMPTWLVTAAAH